MYYNISRTLEYLPYVSWFILGAFLVFFEVKNFRSMLADRAVPDRARGGFIPPPGDGYEYYAGGSILYIVRKGPGRFRVYVATGDGPKVPLKSDRYGRFFSVSAGDSATVEKIIENAYAKV